MTDPQADYATFDELAAGYALDALEPADEQRLVRHAKDARGTAAKPLDSA